MEKTHPNLFEIFQSPIWKALKRFCDIIFIIELSNISLKSWNLFTRINLTSCLELLHRAQFLRCRKNSKRRMFNVLGFVKLHFIFMGWKKCNFYLASMQWIHCIQVTNIWQPLKNSHFLNKKTLSVRCSPSDHLFDFQL